MYWKCVPLVARVIRKPTNSNGCVAGFHKIFFFFEKQLIDGNLENVTHKKYRRAKIPPLLRLEFGSFLPTEKELSKTRINLNKSLCRELHHSEYKTEKNATKNDKTRFFFYRNKPNECKRIHWR